MPQPDIYDTVAYPGSANPDSHPNRLAVMALLHGLSPAPVDHCRVLEIGCNEGRNLIPMAYAIPGSRFVGFDLAAQPIARGEQRIAHLGLSNVRLFQADLMEVDASLGSFDYIIAHGVYAWVLAPVRDALLAHCRKLLAPRGIAFISYNALPGGHLRNLVRDILLQPAASQEAAQTAAHSLELLHFITQSRPEKDPYRGLLEQEFRQIGKKSPHILFHDEMAPHFNPVSFSSFVTHASTHALQYVSDSVLPPPNDPIYQPALVERAKSFANGDAIAEEQILDFLRMRMFRETLLCHAGLTVDPSLCIEGFLRLRLASQADASDGETPGTRVFKLPGGIAMESRDSTTILLMDHLIAAWPESVPMDRIEELLAANHIPFDSESITLLLRLVVARMIDLYAWAAPVSRQIPDRPFASAITREEIVDPTGGPARAATLLHSSITVSDPLVRDLLLLLDGTRDRAALLQALTLAHPGAPDQAIADGLDQSLRLIHRAGVLLA